MLKRSENAASSRVTVPPPSTGASGIRSNLHDAAARPRHRTAHEHQVLVRENVDNRQPPLRDPAAAHLARAAHTAEYAGGRGRGADRTRSADVVRAVRRRSALEVVALDRALEALALRKPG